MRHIWEERPYGKDTGSMVENEAKKPMNPRIVGFASDSRWEYV